MNHGEDLPNIFVEGHIAKYHDSFNSTPNGQSETELRIFVGETSEIEEEFHSNYNDVNVDTALPLRGSSLSDHTRGKQERTNNCKRHWRYIAVLVSLCAVIVGLSLEIWILNRRSGVILDQQSSDNPSFAPSSIPSSIPSLSLLVSKAAQIYVSC